MSTGASELISEALQPCADAPPAGPPQAGAPVLPSAFDWRGATAHVAAVLEEWKQSSPCTHGSAERYLRTHWYRLRMDDGAEWTVYFLRQPPKSSTRRARWWLYTRTPAHANS